MTSQGRVTGIGGVFFKSNDPARLRAWYEEHLGIGPGKVEGFDESTVAFAWREPERPEVLGYTIWGPFPRDTTYFDPSTAPFMINYRVENLDALLERLRKEGVDVDERVEEYPYGRFAWIQDLEGNRIELWEPPPSD